MNDLISRQTVINEINERQRKLIYCFGFENDMVNIMDIAKSIVIAIPSAQPERKKGYWKHINEEEERAKHNGQLLGWMPWYCSECGYGVGKHQTAFCPNCGADMRREQDERFN